MIVYMATNVNNLKYYIGQTSVSLSERIGDHRRKAMIHSSRSHFHSAIRKWGFDSFVWQVIDRANTREELNEKERYWIEHLRSHDPSVGYNNTLGGDSFKFTEEAKKRIGDSQRGIARSEQFKKRLAEISKGEGNPFFGRHHTEEAKRRNRDAHIGKKLSREHVKKCLKRGSDNGRAVVNEEIVSRIKAMIRDGTRTCEIMREFKITKNIVNGIKRGSTWRHVEP